MVLARARCLHFGESVVAVCKGVYLGLLAWLCTEISCLFLFRLHIGSIHFRKVYRVHIQTAYRQYTLLESVSHFNIAGEAQGSTIKVMRYSL